MIYYVTNQNELESDAYKLGTPDMVLAMLRSSLVVGLDTETTGLDPHTSEIRLLTLGNESDTYVIDVRTVGLSWLVDELSCKERLYIAHNMKFDFKMLLSKKVKLHNIYCSLIAEQLITKGLQYKVNLAATLKRRFGVEMNKEVRKEFTNKDLIIQTRHIIYAAKDVEILFKLQEAQYEDILKYGLREVLKLELNSLKVVADIEFQGIILDTAYWKSEILPILKTKITALNSLLYDYIGRHVFKKIKTKFVNEKVNLNFFEEAKPYELRINWKSNPQKIKFLQQLGYNLEVFDNKKRKTVLKTNKVALKNNATEGFLALRKESEQLEYLKTTTSICDILLLHTEATKIYTTYGENLLKLINVRTGRIHTDFNQLGAITGRFSSRNPNLQNIPKQQKYRSGFVARPGFKIITLDYASAELRIMAEGSNEQAFIDAINLKEDLHSKLAMMMPANKGLVISETVNSHLRQKQKTATFGIAYGAGKEKFGEEFMNDYRQAAPNLFAWLDGQADLAVRTGQTRTFNPFRRLLWLHHYERVMSILNNKREHNQEDIAWAKAKKAAYGRVGKNAPIQGTSADITKMALVLVSKWITQTNQQDKIFIVNQVHDEILIEVEESIAEETAKHVALLMEIAGAYSIKKVRMEVSYHIDDYWKK